MDPARFCLWCGAALETRTIKGQEKLYLVLKVAQGDLTVRVPAENRIGSEGEGFRIAMATLDRSRPTIGAQAVGIAQGAIDAALAYVKERKQFGRSVSEFQGVQFMLADMATQLEAARVMTYRAAALCDVVGQFDHLVHRLLAGEPAHKLFDY